MRTSRGNDRGTRVFRIESEPVVSFGADRVGLAQWHCQATPISEKTGKPMCGASHGADSRATVTIGAGIFLEGSAASDAMTPAQYREAELQAIAAFVSGDSDGRVSLTLQETGEPESGQTAQHAERERG